MKAETPDSPSPAESPQTTPDNTSMIADDDTASDDLLNPFTSPDDDRVRVRTISTATASTAVDSNAIVQKSKDGKDEDASPAPPPSSGNLIGKINNLVTTDLSNLIDGRDFLFIGTSIVDGRVLC